MLVFIVVASIVLLLALILYFRINAFVSLLIASIFVGITTGMPLEEILKSVQSGMGSILGFVAIVVGLGSIFGKILEHSGGADVLAVTLVSRFGKGKASWAMMMTGFIIAIPVFLDVGFIILVPVVNALSRNTGKSVLTYAIPLLAGLAVAHSFIPPTPGPVAVAEILNADIGMVILYGVIVGIPSAILAGPVFGKYIGEKIQIFPDGKDAGTDIMKKKGQPAFGLIVILILLPLTLILMRTVVQTWFGHRQEMVFEILAFMGHPFSALILCVLVASYFLGTRRGLSNSELLKLSSDALGPAGIIILITGAGGVFKQILVDSEVGTMLAELMKDASFSPIFLGFLIATVVRVTQGSATVAMITAAGFMAPLLDMTDFSDIGRTLTVLAIASGATILSHMNDSGFWLVGKYLNLSEKQTLQSWTVAETIISLVSITLIMLLSLLLMP
ncbi:MAG: GntP family permease [Cyclobacteriaceae bacterium]|nr:GntP family permease [Cyclobacteriaceae bacterium]